MRAIVETFVTWQIIAQALWPVAEIIQLILN